MNDFTLGLFEKEGVKVVFDRIKVSARFVRNGRQKNGILSYGIRLERSTHEAEVKEVTYEKDTEMYHLGVA